MDWIDKLYLWIEPVLCLGVIVASINSARKGEWQISLAWTFLLFALCYGIEHIVSSMQLLTSSYGLWNSLPDLHKAIK